MFALSSIVLGKENHKSYIPPSSYWLEHVENDLLPFWMHPSMINLDDAFFPTFRMECGDPVSSDNRNLYSSIASMREGDWILDDIGKNFTRMHARQTFAYGIAYHLTGNMKYFELMYKGVLFSINNCFDDYGAITTIFSDNPDDNIPENRTSQDQAYSLTGLAFYYYLTRDENILEIILKQHNYIMKTYGRYNEVDKLVSLTWLPSDKYGDELVAILDQLNAYMILLAPIIPEPHASVWKNTIKQICYIMIADFFVDEVLLHENTLKVNSFWGNLNEKKIGGKHFDFGHSIKAWWMIYLAGQMLDDDFLISKGRKGMEALLTIGYVPGELFKKAALEQGLANPILGLSNIASWGEKFHYDNTQWWVNNNVSLNQHWWIHCEMDQAAATMALMENRFNKELSLTSRFFVEHYVDKLGKEVWHSIDAATLAPKFMKTHSWKNAYHSFEHALIMAIAGQGCNDQNITLHFVLSEDVMRFTLLQPYYFAGKLMNVSYGTIRNEKLQAYNRFSTAVTFKMHSHRNNL